MKNLRGFIRRVLLESQIAGDMNATAETPEDKIKSKQEDIKEKQEDAKKVDADSKFAQDNIQNIAKTKSTPVGENDKIRQLDRQQKDEKEKNYKQRQIDNKKRQEEIKKDIENANKDIQNINKEAQIEKQKNTTATEDKLPTAP